MSRDRVCEACGAGIGKPCLRANGSEAHRDHLIRVRGAKLTPEQAKAHRTYQRDKYRAKALTRSGA